MTKRRTFSAVKKQFNQYGIDLVRNTNKHSPKDFDYSAERLGEKLEDFRTLGEATDWLYEFRSGEVIIGTLDKENIVDELNKKYITVKHNVEQPTWGKQYEFNVKLQEHFATIYYGSRCSAEFVKDQNWIVAFDIDGSEPSTLFLEDLSETFHDFLNAWNNGGV